MAGKIAGEKARLDNLQFQTLVFCVILEQNTKPSEYFIAILKKLSMHSIIFQKQEAAMFGNKLINFIAL